MPSKHPPRPSSKPQPFPFTINPPLLNSSNPWATTEADLTALYNSPHTGAVTIRTSLWQAFTQHASTHQYTFFSSSIGHATANVNVDLPQGEGRGEVRPNETSSLNTLGYSPIAFETYVAMLVRMSRERGSALREQAQEAKTKHSESGDGELASGSQTKITTGTKTGTETKTKTKPFIVSVTGSAEEVGRCCEHLLEVLNEPEKSYPLPHSNADDASSSDHPDSDLHLDLDLDLMMEINLSCPNIPDKPPPAYDGASLTEYITAIAHAKARVPRTYGRGLYVGIKTPPYTYAGQFQILIDALERSSSSSFSETEIEGDGDGEGEGEGDGQRGGCPISFITATNTLGSSLVLNSHNDPALSSANGSGIGGLAGDALHPLALGNVRTIRTMLDSSLREDVRDIKIIGVGGVSDAAGFRRMMSVGAVAVGVGTALGREGVEIFEKIGRGLEG